MLRRKSSKLTVFFILILLVISFALQLKQAPDAKIEVSLAPEALFYIGSFPITNAFFWEVFLSLILVVMALRIRFSLKKNPDSFQNLIELIIEKGYGFLNSIMRSEKKTKRIFPLVMTMFLFILFANLFTYLPGSAAVSSGHSPLFRAVMSDYGIVLIMTLIAVLLTQIVAIIVNGPFGYIKKFINFSSPLAFVLGLMDIIGELAKILSMSFRLFGNIFAGEVLGGVMLFLMPYFLPLPFMFLGLLSAIIQAFVFSLLTAIFVSMASEISVPEVKESV